MRTFYTFPVLTLLLFSFVLLQGCPKPEVKKAEPPNPSAKIMTVNDTQFTVADLVTAFQEEVTFQNILEALTLENKEDQNELGKIKLPTVEELIKKSGNTLAYEAYYAEKAQEVGLDQLPDFQKYIDDIVKSELYQKLLIEDILSKIRFTEDQLRQYYELNKERHKIKDSNQFLVSAIYVKMNDKTSEEAWKKIQEVHDKLKADEDFDKVAAKYSEAPPEKRGMSQEINVEDFNNTDIPRALMQLNDGEISEIIPSGDKLFIYKRHKYIPPEYVSFDLVKMLVTEFYANEERDRETALHYLSLKDKYKPSLFPEWLSDPQPEQMDAHVISLPGVYEMTLKDFLASAKTQQINTYKDQVEYLNLLAQKSVMAAEAVSRGWNENTVSRIVNYYKNKWLTKEYILSLIQDRLPSEKDMQLSYAQNLTSPVIQVPKKYDLYYLFFPAFYSLEQTNLETENSFLAAQQKALQSYQELKDGTPFEELVTRYSHDEYHLKSKGRIGLLSLNELDPARSDAIKNFNLAAGQFSEPNRISHHNSQRYGYEIYYVKESIPEHPMTYPDARDVMLNAAKQSLYQSEQQKMIQEWENNNPIQYHTQTLEALKDYLIELAKHPDIRQTEIYRFTEPTVESSGTNTP